MASVRPKTQSYWVRVLRPALVVSLALPSLAAAQSAVRPSTSVAYPTSERADRIRLAQLAGDTASLDGYLLRSPSLLPLAQHSALSSGSYAQFLVPTVQLMANSAIAFSMNDGALWAGRGLNARVTGGLNLRRGRLHVVLAPELDFSPNADFSRNQHPDRYVLPFAPEGRQGGGYADPWYARPYSADVPWRFGNERFMRFTPGQSGVWFNTGPVEFGATSENMWWGPGIRNAIVMSDNAGGVPRLEIRSPRPLRTRIGTFEWRWFVGALSESQYFDTTQANDVRSLAAAAVTWRPSFQPNLSLGVTRAVFATASGYGDVPLRWFDVLARTGHPAERALADSALYPGGKDQLFSLFGRWVFPDDGFEAYTEWARQELPKSLHDFIVAPSQSHGYTLGLQYRKPAPLTATTFRIQAEVTTLEQSPTFKNRPVGVFYTSRRVIQGYTEDGQIIGAAIGPGASSQWLALDRVGPRGSVGITFNRIRWNEDVRSTYGWPGYLGDCNHDVSMLPGIRGGHVLGHGYISGELVTGTRLSAFFQNQSGCPGAGSSRVDVHNTSVSISFSPFSQ